jgi:hypothetical protein
MHRSARASRCTASGKSGHRPHAHTLSRHLHSALAPEALTTLAHFSLSAATRAPNAAGLKGIGSLPTSASRAYFLRFARTLSQAAIPALAAASSWLEPATPTAPTSLRSTASGTPPPTR